MSSQTNALTVLQWSHDKVAELKEAFAVLDAAGDGSAPVEDVKKLLRQIAPFMQPSDLDALFAELKMEEAEQVTFPQFFVLMFKFSSYRQVAISTEDEVQHFPFLCEVFRPFDSAGTGFVDEDIFMTLMTTQGTPLTDREAEELKVRLRTLGFYSDNKVNYEAFVNNLILTKGDTML